MEESAFIEKLGLFGLSRQEATIYLCLIKNEALTGYEVAKLTGISRSNVYNGLASLTDHGASYILEGTSTRYTAVSIEEFCDNRIRSMQRLKEELIRNGPGKTYLPEGYITIEGYTHICDKVHHMLLSAEKRIYFAANQEFLEKWRDEIKELVSRGSKVVLISSTTEDVFRNEKWRDGIIFYEQGKAYQDPEEMSEQNYGDRQIRLIIDSEYVLTGEVKGNSTDNCLYSAQKNFVRVIKDAMHNEIELIKLRGNIGKSDNSCKLA